jgi:SAM-dependent methyltransferase
MKSTDEIRSDVRDHYSAVARGAASACCGGGTCGSEKLGYGSDELAAVPEGADLGLGCGNPQAIANLRTGEVVVDLGAGGGIDCFLAGRAVGPTGKVIGVDMSTDMISLARGNARKHGTTNVEFRLGEIEHLPVADASVDVVISNCVINLSPDKPAVFREIARVLRPGGRVAVSDIVSFAPLAPDMAKDVAMYCGCIAGAASVGEVAAMMQASGFADVRVEIDGASREVIAGWAPGKGVEDLVASARITATRAEACCAPGCCA